MDKITLITIAICFVSYVIGHIIEVFLKSDTADELNTKFNIFIKYADAFVVWAKKFMPDSTGEEKMEAVISQLQIIAKKYRIDMNDDEIKAIAQKAYYSMKAGINNDTSLINETLNSIESKDK